MAISSKHPKYIEYATDWDQMNDTYRGERIVKEQGFQYLPATPGMIEDGVTNVNSEGFKSYDAYRKRARFSGIVRDAVEAMLGIMHRKPPVIELPAIMEPLREKATLKNESLEMLLKRINEEQLKTGRCGLLPDLPATPTIQKAVPYLAFYEAKSIINWDAGRRDGVELESLNLVVLEETEPERQDNFEWKEVQKFRVLILGDVQANEGQGFGATYQQGVFREQENFTQDLMIVPSIRGNTLDKIPFTFINTKDIVSDPDEPPLLDLSNVALSIYRSDADYRQALFMQGQDTLVIIGATDDTNFRTGAGAAICLDIGGDAKFIGVDSSGLSEMRAAIENDMALARQKAGQMINAVSRERESGDALRIRVASETATLNQVAITGAFALQDALRNIAIWLGGNPEEVVVTPNLDFVDDPLTGETLVQYMTAKSLGLPWSLEQIHLHLQKKDLTELDFEEEIAKIEEEEQLSIGSSNPDDLEDGDPNNPDDPNEPANDDDPVDDSA
jgi:hypothetical protein